MGIFQYELLRNTKVKKSITLYLTMIFSIAVGIIISVINTRYLGKESYGDFKFIINIFTFVITLLTFGFFYSGGRLVSLSNSKDNTRKLKATVFMIALFISILMILLMLIFSFFEQEIFGNGLGRVIRIVLPLLFIYPFQLSLEQILQGDNRIYSLSLLRIGPKFIYLGVSYLIYYFFEFDLITAIIVHLSSFAFIILVILINQKPLLKQFKQYFKKIKQENKGYGFPVYMGALTGVASSYIAGISIGYYIDNTNVGFYSLAVTATMPLAMLPAAFGTSFFKEFVKIKSIPKHLTYLTILLNSLLLLLFLIFIDEIVIFLYTDEFKEVISLSYFLAVGSFCHGMGDYLNRFMSAKGKGIQLRNSNFLIGSINLIGFTFLVYMFGTQGAAITRLLSGIAYLLIMFYFYRMYQNKL